MELLRLADLAAARHRGVTLEDVRQAFGVSHRTAQRMTQALTDAFPTSVVVLADADRRRRWAMREAPLARMRLAGAAELEALEMAIGRLDGDGDAVQARTLAGLRDRLLAAMPVRDARRAEADAEAILEAHGFAARPGPAVVADPRTSEAVAEALRGPTRIAFGYGGERRLVEPYGVLLGPRRYLVGRQPEKDDRLRHFRIDRIEEPEVTGQWFARESGFDLAAHAARAFGAYQDEAQYGEVIWRFAADAANHAAEWRFHPRQRTAHLPDGRLEVRFEASGWLEMTWHLYQWGDSVEVVAPEGLRRRVMAWRRDDFEALP